MNEHEAREILTDERIIQGERVRQLKLFKESEGYEEFKSVIRKALVAIYRELPRATLVNLPVVQGQAIVLTELLEFIDGEIDDASELASTLLDEAEEGRRRDDTVFEARQVLAERRSRAGNL